MSQTNIVLSISSHSLEKLAGDKCRPAIRMMKCSDQFSAEQARIDNAPLRTAGGILV